MAYGVGTPADDWTQKLSHHTENKTPNSSLANPLTSHGPYCRRWDSNSATDRVMTQYILNNPSTNVGSKSIRGFFRLEDIAHTGLDPISGRILAPHLSIYDTTTTNCIGYIIAYEDSGDGDDTHNGVQFGYGLLTNSYNGISSRVARADNYLYTDAEADGAWMGMRLDVLKEDNDAHIKVYVVKGVANCNALDANGEPDWGSPIIDLIHINGSGVVNPIVGTKVGNLPISTPILDGQASFGFNQYYKNGTMKTYVDSISFKMIDV